MDSGELVRRVNGHILQIADDFAVLFGDDRPMEFFCECGCWETVEMLTAVYRECGAWISGHRETPGKRRYRVRRLP